jgi:hypothetical protein
MHFEFDRQWAPPRVYTREDTAITTDAERQEMRNVEKGISSYGTANGQPHLLGRRR